MKPGLPSLVAPFRALRYVNDRLDAVISPPYDVITPPRRSALAAQDPHNIVRLILPDGDGDKYAHAATLLGDWRRTGVLARDDDPSVYVMRQEFATPDGQTHARTGVIAGLHVEPYASGRVLPHERTHRGPKEDRLALSRATGGMLESIFALSRDDGGTLRNLLERETAAPPAAQGTLDGVGVQLWRVDGSEADHIAATAGAGAVYIADGHHRFETANAYRAENPSATRLPALIVPVGDPGLVVLGTHRIVSGEIADRAALVEAWGVAYAVGYIAIGGDPELLVAGLPADRPSCIVALPDGSAHRLVARAATAGPAIEDIESHVVGPLAAASENRVTYSASARDALTATGDGAAVVLVRPTPVEVVLDVSDAGGIMPAKSTYFAPKVPSGLVIMVYED